MNYFSLAFMIHALEKNHLPNFDGVEHFQRIWHKGSDSYFGIWVFKCGRFSTTAWFEHNDWRYYGYCINDEITAYGKSILFFHNECKNPDYLPIGSCLARRFAKAV